MIILDTLANVNWTNTGHLLVCFNNSLVLSLGKKPFRFYSWYQWSLVTCANQRIFGNLVVFLVGICTNWVLEKDRRKQPDVALQWSCPKLCVLTLRPLCVFFILFEPKIFAFCIVCCSIHSPKGAVRLCHKVFTCVCVSVCIHTYIVQMGHCQEGNQNKLLFFSFPATFTTGRTRQQQALYTFTSFLLSSILHLTNVAIPTGWGTCVFHQYLFKWNMNFISRHGLTLY